MPTQLHVRSSDLNQPTATPRRLLACPVNLTAIFCVLYGVLLILQVQVAGDGMWFWYAKLFLDGRHLYSDLHLALQPLFILITAANLRLMGEGWLLSKLPAVVMLCAYVGTLRAITQRLPLRPGPRAVLLLAGFAFPLLFEAYRFDDYHVMADSFQVGSILLLLTLRRGAGEHFMFRRVTLLGIFSGLAMMARLNDGLFLLAAVLVALAALPLAHKLRALILFITATIATAIVTVTLTGDSLTSYASNSIYHAAGAKGGVNKLVAYPIHLVEETSSHLLGEDRFIVIIACALLLCALLAWIARRPVLRRPGAYIGAGSAVLIVTMLAYIPLLRAHRWAIVTLPRAVCVAMIMAGIVLGVATLLRATLALSWRQPKTWEPEELLLLIPLGQLVSGSLSSGGEYLPLNAPVGVLLLLLPFAYPRIFGRADRGYAYAGVIGLASVCCIAYKTAVPFSWQTYHTAPMFTSRQWYYHPIYGPMVIETDLLNFMLPMCKRINDTGGRSLLTLPFPYPNYFCGVRPWHDAVQTFFDTSTAQTINEIEKSLEVSPPHTIVYQRQVLNMLMHERLYTGYKPLPHRALDATIVDRLSSGVWSVTHQQCVQGSDWIEIETVPQTVLSSSRGVVFNGDPYRCTDRHLAESLELDRQRTVSHH